MRLLTTSSFALLLAFSGVSANAQDDAASADEAFPTAQALAGIAATYGDWEIHCNEDGANCRMAQTGQDPEGNQIASVSMQKLPEGSAAQLGVVVITPLLTLLTRGMTMGVDDGVPAAYPYSWCDNKGCYARFGLTAAQVDEMKNGNEAYVEIYAITAADAPIRASLSLSGFTAAFDDLQGR